MRRTLVQWLNVIIRQSSVILARNPDDVATANFLQKCREELDRQLYEPQPATLRGWFPKEPAKPKPTRKKATKKRSAK